MGLGTDSLSADENDYLIQHVEKKENLSSKKYEMSKWSFYNAILVTD